MKRSTLLWIVKQIRHRIPAICLMVLLQISSSLISVYFALGTRNVIDSATAMNLQLFMRACLQLGLMILGLLICYVLVRSLRSRISADLDRDWKKSLLSRLLRSEYSAVSGYHSAELLNRMNGDVSRVIEGILGILPGALTMVVRLVAAVAVMGALDLRFTLLLTAMGLVLIVTSGLFRNKLKDLNKRVAEQDGKVYGFFQETLEKLLLVQAMDIAPETEQRAAGLLDLRYRTQRTRRRISLVTGTGMNFLSSFASFLALIWCAWQIILGQMTFGSLTAILQLVNQLQSPFMGLSGIMPRHAALLASAERLMELESIPLEQAPAEDNPQDLYTRAETVGGSGIHFSFDREILLEDASFSLPKGSFAVITGPSGIGKSTLLKLMLGIWHPETGELYIQTPENRITLDRKTRRLFAYVPQGNLLFSGTIRENLTITKPDATEEELRQALYISGMDSFLSQLPKGLDTLLGENALGLSEGQAQRLSIARACISGAPILLLDECTSALDAETEALVLQRLKALPDKTCIAVTHRPAAIDLADIQIHIENRKLYTHSL